MTLFNHTEIQLDAWDAIKALFGRKIYLSTEIDVSEEVEVSATRQTVNVAPLFPKKHKGEGLLISTNKQYEI